MSELAAIRERDARWNEVNAAADRRALLAHIDAITERVEGLPTDFHGDGHGGGWHYVDHAAVLAILKGER